MTTDRAVWFWHSAVGRCGGSGLRNLGGANRLPTIVKTLRLGTLFIKPLPVAEKMIQVPVLLPHFLDCHSRRLSTQVSDRSFGQLPVTRNAFVTMQHLPVLGRVGQ